MFARSPQRIDLGTGGYNVKLARAGEYWRIAGDPGSAPCLSVVFSNDLLRVLVPVLVLFLGRFAVFRRFRITSFFVELYGGCIAVIFHEIFGLLRFLRLRSLLHRGLLRAVGREWLFIARRTFLNSEHTHNSDKQDQCKGVKMILSTKSLVSLTVIAGNIQFRISR